MTPDTEVPVTKQSMFDDAVRHLLTQNAKSQNRNGCVYFDAKTGHKCVLGARALSEVELAGLVDATLYRTRLDVQDEKVYGETGPYKPGERAAQMEAVRGRFERVKSVLRVPDELVDFAIELQVVHDTRDVCEWSSALRALGLRDDLDLAVLDSFAVTGGST